MARRAPEDLAAQLVQVRREGALGWRLGALPGPGAQASTGLAPSHGSARRLHTRAQAKEALTRLSEEHKQLQTEKRRLAAQLVLAKHNVVKAEELLNNKERELSATQVWVKAPAHPPLLLPPRPCRVL